MEPWGAGSYDGGLGFPGPKTLGAVSIRGSTAGFRSEVALRFGM